MRSGQPIRSSGAGHSRARVRKTDVLPTPFSPHTTRFSPLATEKDKPSTSATPVGVLMSTSRTEIASIASASEPAGAAFGFASAVAEAPDTPVASRSSAMRMA